MYKSIGAIEIPINKLLLINDNEEKLITCGYVKEADNKAQNVNIFDNYLPKNVRKLSKKIIVKEKVKGGLKNVRRNKSN